MKPSTIDLVADLWLVTDGLSSRGRGGPSSRGRGGPSSWGRDGPSSRGRGDRPPEVGVDRPPGVGVDRPPGVGVDRPPGVGASMESMFLAQRRIFLSKFCCTPAQEILLQKNSSAHRSHRRGGEGGGRAQYVDF